MSTKHSVVIVGGGAGGLSVASRLLQADPRLDVVIVEPSEQHFYQPLWTLVGGGVFPREQSVRPQAEYIPPGAKWIRERVSGFDPERRRVTLGSGAELEYEQLVVALGMQLDWHRIKGLEGNLGKDGVCSNYSYDTVASTWRFLKEFRGGNAIFTFPSTPVKCAGAPQKIMYLADDWLRKAGVRGASRVIYASATPAIFGVKHYREALEPIVQRKGIETLFRHDLVEVRAASKEAIFRKLDGGEEVVLPYELLHVVPPQSAPDVIKKSPLASKEGWVEVDKFSLQHTRFPEVFSLGDNSSLPTSRTGAAIRKQAPVLAQNLLAARAGGPLLARYDGYASCPLVTGYGKLILAEFDYDGNPMESFPFDQRKERYSMYAMKAYALPEMYWNGMLRGRA
ncbi:MAG: NAD(P)/FAD-dependent oxidoreductase [Polyangiaceae bacterium]|jgi:sulfide:quinone oxidoreductase|nr:NAD(P)/FAD-dependent oxidoreductase [Polyangiaceae bacterium]